MPHPIVAEIPRNLSFRYRIPCARFEAGWSPGMKMPAAHQIPLFGFFDEQNTFADIRLGWHPSGLLIRCTVSGKKKSLWCRATQVLESDGLQVWIDTRNTGNVHRATRFCHWFALLPAGAGSNGSQPVATMLKINRAREDSPSFHRREIPIAAKTSEDGYELKALLPAECLHGWDPDEHRQLGFSLAIVDREFGFQTLGCGPELPVDEDPSLWQVLELVDG